MNIGTFVQICTLFHYGYSHTWEAKGLNGIEVKTEERGLKMTMVKRVPLQIKVSQLADFSNLSLWNVTDFCNPELTFPILLWCFKLCFPAAVTHPFMFVKWCKGKVFFIMYLHYKSCISDTSYSVRPFYNGSCLYCLNMLQCTNNHTHKVLLAGCVMYSEKGGVALVRLHMK